MTRLFVSLVLAMSLCGNISAAAPNVPAELLPLARKGKEEFERGNYLEAEKIYREILTTAPDNLYTLSNLGVVLFRAGKNKSAEEEFKRAIAVAPEDGFSHCTLGIVYYQEGKYDDAVSELTRALAINPQNATAHNYLGMTASQKGWQEAAQKEFETAATLDPAYGDKELPFTKDLHIAMPDVISGVFWTVRDNACVVRIHFSSLAAKTHFSSHAANQDTSWYSQTEVWLLKGDGSAIPHEASPETNRLPDDEFDKESITYVFPASARKEAIAVVVKIAGAFRVGGL